MTQPGPHPEGRGPGRDGTDGASLQEGDGGLAVAVLGVVGLPAARLGQAAGDHVPDGEDGGVEPDLPRAVAAGICCVHDSTSNKNADQDGDVCEELGRLEGRLRLGAETADGLAGRHSAGHIAIGNAAAGCCGGAHVVLLGCLNGSPASRRSALRECGSEACPVMVRGARAPGPSRPTCGYPRARSDLTFAPWSWRVARVRGVTVVRDCAPGTP